MQKNRSLLALDWINFFLADVETGAGPFIATYLASARHYDPAQIGAVLAAQKIFAVLAQIPAGSAIDGIRYKKWLMVIASVVIGAGALMVALLGTVRGQIANQAMVGVATAVATPLIAAISLGMVGQQGLGRRIGRNEGFNHAGNLLTAVLAGYLGYAMGLQSIFYVCGALGVVCALSALLLRSNDINDEVARGGTEKPVANLRVAGFREVLARPAVLTFAAIVVLFHVANAAMLPLMSEELTRSGGRATSEYMSAALVVAQLVMIPIASLSGRLADRIGRKPILLVAFGALVLRGVLFSLARDPHYLVAIEAFDGIGTGISGVLTVLITADLAKGTRRFNFLQGALQTCLGLGAFLGNLVAGIAAKSLGFSATFLGLALAAAAGMILMSSRMPETLARNPRRD